MSKKYKFIPSGPYGKPERRWGFPTRVYIVIHFSFKYWYWGMLIPRMSCFGTCVGDLNDLYQAKIEDSIDFRWLIFSVSFHWDVNYFELSWKGQQEAIKKFPAKKLRRKK